MQTFNEILASLPDTSHLQGIRLMDANRNAISVIENKPGSQGSVKVYHHLLKKYGQIDTNAAQEGLALYCEHTGDAKANAGKHPNIDRLLHVIESAMPLHGELY
jgi:hypothetical protein